MAYRDNPFEQMNRLFEQMRQSWGHPSMFESSSDRQPALGDPSGGMVPFDGSRDEWWSVDTNVTLEETDGGYVVMADLPGFETEDLSIRFEDGVLTVRGESEVAEESEHGSRRRSRRVHERISVPGTVDVEGIEASYHNGVLEVSLPTEDDHADDAHHIDID